MTLLFDGLHQWSSFVMLDDIQRDDLLLSQFAFKRPCVLKGLKYIIT